MANEEQLALLKQGAQAWNTWREQNNLEPVCLKGADLRGAVLINANLSAADLSGAHIGRADLTSANLTDANLSDATLYRADLRNANLIRASLVHTNLIQANLSSADLDRANLTGAYLQETILANTNLTAAVGLDTSTHRGPSTVDYRTLAKSGSLPMSFLRGCGLPESLITYLPSLLNQAIQFYSCFISYSTKDQEFADRLHADLQNKGVRCWFAPHDMAAGKKIHEQIDEAIRLHDKLLLILSEHSMNSGWVQHEIRKARKREVTEKRRKLFPVSLVGFKPLEEWECFDADTRKDLAVEIREFFIPDFSTWATNHTAYKEAFDKLIRDLKAKDRKAAEA